MADLEKLAVKRDRGYLVRLIVSLVLGIAAALFFYRGLTGDMVTGCMTDAIMGATGKDDAKAPE